MNTKMKMRMLSLLLCFVMLVGLMPTTALAKSGTGTQQDPVIVSTFAELKEALEEDEDTWIVVNQFNNGSYYTLISGDDYTETSLDQSAYECGAINIPTGKNKHLTINTTIDCRTASTQSGSLLYSFINNRGNLTIDGTGTIAVSFNAGNYANAIIFNQGELNIDAPITLDATCKTVQTFGRAILNHTGTFNISDGTYIGFKSKYLGTSGNVGAIYNSNTDDNDQSVISGGLFETFYEDGRLNLSYALLNGGVDNLTLKGGTFYGIYASQFSLKLSALLGTGCRYTYKNGGGEYDGSDAPETTAALVVENNNLIPTVELTVTTPVAGDSPATPSVSTENTSIYAFEWYKGDTRVYANDTFEGGQTYKLKVRVATTKEFPNNVAVKVNGEAATVLAVDNNNTNVLFEKSFTVPVSGYTLSFDASGGSGSMAPLTNAMSYILPDCTFTAPSGKQFAGWNVFGTIYDVGDIVYLSANTTAYAEWEDVQASGYTLAFDANGGSGSMAPLTGQTSYTLPACTFTAPSGKQFAGWNVFGYTQSVGDIVYLSSNMTAQAVWENIPQQDQPITAIVISCSGYVVGGNIAEAVPTTSSTGVTIASYEWQDNNGTKLTSGTFAADTQYRLRVFLNVADGYTANSLEKANVKINGTETTYFTNPCTGVDAQYGDMMIYHYPARLTAPQPTEYMVSYNANGGSGTMVGDMVEENGKFTLENCTYIAPEGYQFKAWAIGSVNGEQKQPGEQITITAETYIYAIWEAVEYNVTVTGGTASVGAGTPITKATMGTTVTLTAGAAPTGQMFDKWVVNGVVVDDANSATTTFVMPAGNVTAEATYKDIPVVTYTVTFDSAGGSAVTAQTIEAGQKATKPADPTKAGYDFKGWTLNGSAYDFNTAVNGNITLVATWEQQQVVPTVYTVTFDSNGGSAVTAQNIEEGQKATKPADPTKSGYDFKGWTLNGSAYDFNTAVNGDITLVATWEQQQVVPTVYTVTFDSNGGSAVTAQNIEEGQKATKPADPTKSGYDFKGWTLNGSAYDFNTAVNGDITLVATWEQQQVVPTTYTVSFAANGGTGTMADVTGISGEYTLPENGFTAPDGKQFKAWSVGVVEKAVGDKITVTADTTVTAVWETIPAGHTCDIKPVAKVEPSCTEGGKEAYYKCEGCGKFYEDALGAKEITDLAAWGNIAKNGHTESDWKSDKDNHWKECTVAACGVIIENSRAAHADANNDGKCDTCEYNVGTTTTNPNNKPSDDVQSPQTGDNSMMWLWVALLFVSGFGVVATTVIGKKKSSAK